MLYADASVEPFPTSWGTTDEVRVGPVLKAAWLKVKAVPWI